jgi:putative transcriptional regulator
VTNSPPEALPATEGGQQKKTGRRLDGYTLLILGVLLWIVGGQFNNKPLVGQYKLLVATPSMKMEELKKTVVFLVRHTRAGAYGIVINRPGKKGAAGDGGPVEKPKLFALHTLDIMLPETRVMREADLGFLDDEKAIERLKGAKTKPAWYIIVSGYAGWDMGQMEQELRDGLWTLVDFRKDAVTATPAAKLWDATKKFPQIQMTR